jgi:hypothetical protein
MNPEDLEISQAYDSALLAANFTKTLEDLDLDNEERIENAALLIDKLDKQIQSTPDCNELRFWKIGLIGLRILRTASRCQNMAIRGSGNLLEERERLSVLWAALKKEVSKLSRKDNGIGEAKLPSEVNIGENIDELIIFLKALPLPTLYFRKNEDERKQIQARKEAQNEDTPPLIRLIAYIDNTPLLTPQLLHPQLLYSLKFIIRGVSWPDKATKLHLDLPTTLPRTDYSISKFELPRPYKSADEFEGELNGHIRFTSSQTLLSENISFVVRCAFELQNGQFDEIPVIGYNQLEFHIIDPKSSGFFSGYPRLDQHVVQLLNRLLADNPSIKDELDDLIPLLQELTNLVGVYAQGAVFQTTQKILERDFQAKVVHDLRLKLGTDIQEHPSQAGGYIDIRYRGIVVELKIEKENGDRKYIGERYSAQAVQYQSVEGKQVSVVLVLDLTPKISPPSDIRNDIFLVSIPTHGGEDSEKQYQSKAFIFVVNGNMKKPSEYSRKRKKEKT